MLPRFPYFGAQPNVMSDSNEITREAENWRALIEVLGALLSERISVTEGCRRVSRLAFDLNQRRNKLFLPFVGALVSIPKRIAFR